MIGNNISKKYRKDWGVCKSRDGFGWRRKVCDNDACAAIIKSSSVKKRRLWHRDVAASQVMSGAGCFLLINGRRPPQLTDEVRKKDDNDMGGGGLANDGDDKGHDENTDGQNDDGKADAEDGPNTRPPDESGHDESSDGQNGDGSMDDAEADPDVRPPGGNGHANDGGDTDGDDESHIESNDGQNGDGSMDDAEADPDVRPPGGNGHAVDGKLAFDTYRRPGGIAQRRGPARADSAQPPCHDGDSVAGSTADTADPTEDGRKRMLVAAGPRAPKANVRGSALTPSTAPQGLRQDPRLGGLDGRHRATQMGPKGSSARGSAPSSSSSSCAAAGPCCGEIHWTGLFGKPGDADGLGLITRLSNASRKSLRTLK